MNGPIETVVCVDTRQVASLALCFEADKGVILSVHAPQVVGPTAMLRRFGRWAALVIEKGVPPTDAFQIAVTTSEPSSITPTVIPNSSASVRRMAAAAIGPVPWQTLEKVELHSLQSAPSVIASLAGTCLRDLDCGSNELLLRERGTHEVDLEVRRPAIHLAVKILLARLAARFDGAAIPRMPRSLTAYMSVLQLDAAKPLLASAVHCADSEQRVLQAYALFGSGELFLESSGTIPRLASRLSNGGPNSALVFAFPEFAVAAIEQEVDVRCWSLMLPGLCAACDLFLTCYRPDTSPGGLPPKFEDYGGIPRIRLRPNEIADTVDRYRQLRAEDCEACLRQLLKRGFRQIRPEFAPVALAHPST